MDKVDENKCTFCPDGEADLQTVGGQPICIDCANACPALVGKGSDAVNKRTEEILKELDRQREAES